MVLSTAGTRRQAGSASRTRTTLAVGMGWEGTRVGIRRRWVDSRMLSLKHVTVAAQGANQLLLRVLIELAAETGDVDFDHVPELLPVVVIEMLEQFGFRDDGARAMREVLEHPVFHGG